MDLPRAQVLKQLQLSLSAEGRRLFYYLSDLSSGKVITVPRDSATALLDMKIRLDGGGSAEPPDRNSMEAGARALGYVKSLRHSQRVQNAKFNPIFIQIPLFDVGPWQDGLARFARWFVGWPAVLLFAALAAFAFVLGVRNDWAIRSEFSGLLSIEAILAFGLLSPFLKILHEFGHVIVATAVGVRVRNAAVTLIAFYPLPSVDCSEADVSAGRRERILISLAGILADFLIGLVAFIAWHFLEGDRLQGLAGRVLAFSTMSSLLFNANPLMKLDGYYVIVDVIGQRNLYTRAAQQFARLRQWIVALGAVGAVPRRSGEWGLAGYGAATLLYRITLTFKILSGILPQYLGLGLVVGLWGAYLMFIAPWLADPVPNQKETAPAYRIWLGRIGFGIGAAALIAFVRMPFALTLDLHLEASGRYAVTAGGSGIVETPPPLMAQVQPGQTLFTLVNAELIDQASLLAMDLTEANLLLSATQSLGGSQSQMAQERYQSVMAQIAVVDREIAELTTVAQASGTFLMAGQIWTGLYINGGGVVGHLYQDTGTAQLTGAFPERWVEMFQEQTPLATLRLGPDFSDVDSANLSLIEESTTDPSTGLRSIRLNVEVERPAETLLGTPIQIRLDFGRRTLWEHMVFWGRGKMAIFRDAQLADRENRIE